MTNSNSCYRSTKRLLEEFSPQKGACGIVQQEVHIVRSQLVARRVRQRIPIDQKVKVEGAGRVQLECLGASIGPLQNGVQADGRQVASETVFRRDQRRCLIEAREGAAGRRRIAREGPRS